jgi:hypothetical protein
MGTRHRIERLAIHPGFNQASMARLARSDEGGAAGREDGAGDDGGRGRCSYDGLGSRAGRAEE